MERERTRELERETEPNDRLIAITSGRQRLLSLPAFLGKIRRKVLWKNNQWRERQRRRWGKKNTFD